MERDPHVTPEEAQELIAGRLPSGRDDLADLVAFLREAGDTAHEGPDPLTEQRHLTAMSDATHLEPQADLYALRSRRSVMLETILRSKWFKASAAAIAAVLATGGLAAAQAFPAPAQDAIATVANRVGIDLPKSQETEADEADDADAKVKDGMDHDGDGVADDNGNHTGQTKVKDGADHDGDGVADDNGNHTGQTKVKNGADHDGDGVPDDNGNHYGQTKDHNGPDDGDVENDDQGQQGDDDQGEVDDDHGESGQHHGGAPSGSGQSHGNSQGHGSDD